MIEQPAIGMFAELGWTTVSAMEDSARAARWQHTQASFAAAIDR
jgi:hypothetical protein